MYDPQPMFNALTSLIGKLPQSDRDVLASIYEHLQRALTDLYHEKDQINASKSFISMPTYLQRDWLLRNLMTSEFIGTPHGHFDSTEFVAVGGETTIAIGRPLDPSASYLWIDGVEVPQGQNWSFDMADPLNPSIDLQTPAMPGQVFRIYGADTKAIAVFAGDGVTRQFSFPSMVRAEGIKVFHDNVDLISGIVIRRREVLFMGGLTSGQIVRFIDGTNTHNVVAASGQVRVTSPFDITDSTIIRLHGINIRDPFRLDDDQVTFKTAPRVGVTIRIEGPKIFPHDHAVYSEAAVLAQTVFNTPEPMIDGVYDADRPVFVYINGVLASTTLYTFTADNQITFVAGFLGGEIITIFYHTPVEFSHAHPVFSETLVMDLPANTGLNLNFLEQNRPALVMVDGLVYREGTGLQAFQVKGANILFGDPLPAGSRILIIGEKFQWRWVFSDFDAEIISVAKIQNGINEPTDVLLPGVDFLIFEGKLYLDRLVSPAWFYDVQLDLQTPFNNFGFLIDFEPGGPTTQEYVDLLKSLWAAIVGGSTHWVMENFGRVMIGSPVARFPGVVKKVESTPESTVIDIEGDDDVVRRFTLKGFPPAVSPGDRVNRFTALGGGLNVIDSMVEPNWYARFGLFLYAVEHLSPQFEVAALWDKGLRTDYLTSAVADYDPVTHSIQITKSAFDFKWFEDINNSQGRATLFYPAGRFDTLVDRVEELPGVFQVFFDPAFPIAPPAGIPQIEFEFARARRFDLDFVFDEYLNEHLDPVAEQVFRLLEANLFLVEIEEGIQVGQSRLNLLNRLLQRVKAAETNYIILGKLPSLTDQSNWDIVETDPTDPANFVQIPAYLVTGLGAYGINYTGP